MLVSTLFDWCDRTMAEMLIRIEVSKGVENWVLALLLHVLYQLHKLCFAFTLRQCLFLTKRLLYQRAWRRFQRPIIWVFILLNTNLCWSNIYHFLRRATGCTVFTWADGQTVLCDALWLTKLIIFLLFGIELTWIYYLGCVYLVLTNWLLNCATTINLILFYYQLARLLLCSRSW